MKFVSRRLRRRRDERGVTAILFGILVVCLMMIAAFAVDITAQVSERHGLKNQLDSTAVSAGFFMDSGTDSIRTSAEAAWQYYQENGSVDGLTQNEFYERLDFWCIVARKKDSSNQPALPEQVAAFQIATNSLASSVCNPDARPADTNCQTNNNCWLESNYQTRTRRWDSTTFKMSCSDTVCAVPCALNAGPDNNWNPGTSSSNSQRISCNTLRIASEKGVPFEFAPAGGIAEGSTGAQVSVACKGSCGTVAPNPMDVVVIADRTPSMSTANRHQLVDGIRSMLQVMTPAQQFVSIGTIARSATTTRSTSACPNSYNSSELGSVNATGGLTTPSQSVTTGQWVPLKFYNNYLTAAGTVDNNSDVGKALTCIYNGNSSQGGTTLAAPLKAAARYLLNTDPNNIATELNGGARSGEIKKVIIFETDGVPQEWLTTSGSPNFNSNSNNVSLGDSADPIVDWRSFTRTQMDIDESTTSTNVNRSSLGVSPTPPATWRVNGTTYQIRYNKVVRTFDNSTTSTLFGGQQACKNFQQAAANAKAQGILIITIGYNLSASNLCSAQNTCIGQPGGCPSANYSTFNGTYISDIQPRDGSWNSTQRDNCRSGNGTRQSPYVHRTSTCVESVDITYTQLSEATGNQNVNRADDQSVTDVLASVAGGNGAPPTSSNGCVDDAGRSAENADGDYFFCAASGDDMAPIFVSALSQVNKGVRLLNPNSGLF